MRTLSSAIEWWSKDTPDTPALVLAGEALTYRDYRAWSDRIAVKLMGLGVGPGDRVGISAANSLEYCALIMGVIRAGAIVVPLNIRYTAHEMKEILGDTTPRIVVCDRDRAERFADLGVDRLDMGEIVALRHGAPVVVELDLDPEAPVVIISTSGSTAKPKGVVFSHRTMLNYVNGFSLEDTTCSKGARVISPAPLSTSAGFVQLIHYTVTGCTIYLESAFDPELFLQILVREKINAFGAVPLFFERIAACPGFATADLSSLQFTTTGGARVSPALQAKWMEKGVVLRQIYGQTECGGNATMMPRDLAVEHPDKCGRGGIFSEMAIIDSEGRRCPPGVTGQIILRGPGHMLGYWNNPEATAAAIQDGWLHTGDLGVMDENGLLTFVDRLKDIIISGGLNISAAEVERAISEYDGVEEVMVIAANDAKFGETPLAVIFASQPIKVTELISHCNARLADYKVPRYVVVEDEPLPRLATGKLSKPAVRLKYKEAAATLPRVR